ncbi:MAG: sigma-54-dependent Fis family transcriptional regulator [Alphaproteobacteria bacterium]|nr:sigma-54-dependent Fis family transcriptional regulator [Alphaproteobacteria bacterium]
MDLTPDPYLPTTMEASTEDEAWTADSTSDETLSATVLYHPDPRRVGDRVSWPASREMPIARTSPLFEGALGQAPLESPRVSRAPVRLQVLGDGLHVRAEGRKQAVRLGGQELEAPRTLPLEQVQREGVLLELGRSVLLWVHAHGEAAAPVEDLGLIGVSPSIAELRERIRLASRASAPVLIRGETGSGKELVARAIHHLGPRAQRPWVTVNMAAIPPELAAATLFGHARGAFTGAVSASPGLFGQADGGTLFLDEVGETPGPVQPQLLRTLDSGEIQPAGRASTRVDVRVIAATDADLEARIHAGDFRKALYYRLRGVLVPVAPLRARRVDVPLLLLHFLREELARLGALSRLMPPAPHERPWLGLKLVLSLMAQRFPGNVRELRSLATQIALYSAARPAAALPPELLQSTPSPAPASDATDLSPAHVREVMRRHRWKVGPSAKALGVSRNTLVAAVEAAPDLRLARDLEAGEIQAALAASGGDEAAAAAALEVSTHGFKLRATALGLRG